MQNLRYETCKSYIHLYSSFVRDQLFLPSCLFWKNMLITICMREQVYMYMYTHTHKHTHTHPNTHTHTLSGEVKPNCEYQQTCSSRGQKANRAEVTCYDGSCSNQNGLPVRMCRDCHNKRHKDISSNSRHFFQGTCTPLINIHHSVYVKG